MDQRYLDYSYSPINSLLKKLLNIELYNEIYFQLNAKNNKSNVTDKLSQDIDR